MDTLALRPSFSPSIYSESTRKTVTGSIVLEDNILRYFMNLVNQDSASVSVDTSLLTEQSGKDIEFDFDVYSSKQCTINFTGFSTEQYTVLRGLTSFRVTKYGGMSQWIIKLKSEDYQRKEERVLKWSSDGGEVYHNVDRCTGSWYIFGSGDVNEFRNSDRWNIYGNRKIYIHSTYGILLTKMQINVNIGWSSGYNYPTSIKIFGSNDMDTWIPLASDTNPSYVAYTKYFLNIENENNTYFRHFRVEFEVGIGQNECYLPFVYFFGIKDPNISYTYRRIIPYMTANPQAGAQAIFDTTNAQDLVNFPQYWFPQYIGQTECYVIWLDGDMSNPLVFYIKVNEARKPALFRIRHYKAYDWRPIQFFKIYGSNSETVENEGDDETLATFQSKTWTLIYVRQDDNRSYDHDEFMSFPIECDTAYKYFKFEAISTYDYSKWRHYGMQLYYKDYGTFPEFDSLVPKLNSNTQDGYMLNCSSEDDGQAYRAFDDNIDTFCGGQISEGEWYLITKMAASTIISTISMTAPSSEYNRMPLQFMVEGSNDMTTWTILYTQNNEDPWLTSKETRTWHFENSTGYIWYRLRVLRTDHGTRVRIASIKFGVQEKIPGVSWYEDEYLVPVMSSNSQDGYNVICSGYYGNPVDEPQHVFDRSTNTFWCSVNGQGVNSWIGIQLPEKKEANMFIISSAQDRKIYAPTSFDIEGSNDGETWTTILSVSNAEWTNTNSPETLTYSLDVSVKYSYYRLYVNSIYNSNSAILSRFDITNRTYHDTLEREGENQGESNNEEEVNENEGE